MTIRDEILAGGYKTLDLLIQNRDDWKKEAETREKIIQSLIAQIKEKGMTIKITR